MYALPLRSLLMVVLAAGALLAAGSVPAPASQELEVIEIAAERFAFSPSRVRVRAGATVQFRLSSDDTSHGFRILGTNVNVRIPKRGRGEATVTFTPTQPGTYVFECSYLCGAGHDFMRGELVVEE